ncbi:hypothetical protein J3A66_003667 [Sphingomonas sp. PvP018]|nr:hypothetical protein [Sphingomonas sp. PvP018]
MDLGWRELPGFEQLGELPGSQLLAGHDVSRERDTHARNCRCQHAWR